MARMKSFAVLSIADARLLTPNAGLFPGNKLPAEEFQSDLALAWERWRERDAEGVPSGIWDNTEGEFIHHNFHRTMRGVRLA